MAGPHHPTRLHPRFGSVAPAEANRRAQRAERGNRQDEAALWRNLAELRQMAEAERVAIEPLAAHGDDKPMIEIPLLPTDVHDLEALEHIAALLPVG